MFITLTNAELIEIGKQLLKEKEWINYVRDYPNLRGVFSRRWGPEDKPQEQLETFLKHFLTEEQYIVLSETLELRNDILVIKDDSPEKVKRVYNAFKDDFEIKVTSNTELISEISNILKKRIFYIFEELESSAFEKDYLRVLDTFMTILDNIKVHGINTIYKFEKHFYPREFVKFYLQHIKCLSRAEIFNICRTIGGQIHEDLTPTSFEDERGTIFEAANVLFYTLPRGGLEVLGIFLYANGIRKGTVPLVSYIHFPKDKIIDNLYTLKRHIDRGHIDALYLSKSIEGIINDLKDIEGPAEITVFGGNVEHTNIRTIFLIDDYFASGENLLQLFRAITAHFRNVPLDKIKAISILKRRALNRMPELTAHTIHFYYILRGSYYGILTEDIREIYRIFPDFKRLINGEVDEITLDKQAADYFQQDIFHKKDIDNLIITCVFPHSIADGKTEALLRLLYGHRFKHSTRERLNFLSNLIKTYKKTFNGKIK